jgi:hypothetical protein
MSRITRSAKTHFIAGHLAAEPIRAPKSAKVHRVGSVLYWALALAPWLLGGVLGLTAFIAGLYAMQMASFASIGERICQTGPLAVEHYQCIQDTATACYLDPQEDRNARIYAQIHFHNMSLTDCLHARRIPL